MIKLLHFLKINADPTKAISRRPFPVRPPFCFLLGMAYIVFKCCLNDGEKTRPSCTHLLNVNMFHLEKEETKLI